MKKYIMLFFCFFLFLYTYKIEPLLSVFIFPLIILSVWSPKLKPIKWYYDILLNIIIIPSFLIFYIILFMILNPEGGLILLLIPYVFWIYVIYIIFNAFLIILLKEKSLKKYINYRFLLGIIIILICIGFLIKIYATPKIRSWEYNNIEKDPFNFDCSKTYILSEKQCNNRINFIISDLMNRHFNGDLDFYEKCKKNIPKKFDSLNDCYNFSRRVNRIFLRDEIYLYEDIFSEKYILDRNPCEVFEFKENCYIAFAKYHNNPYYCYFIKDKNAFNSCFSNLKINIKINSTHCKDINCIELQLKKELNKTINSNISEIIKLKDTMFKYCNNEMICKEIVSMFPYFFFVEDLYSNINLTNCTKFNNSILKNWCKINYVEIIPIHECDKIYNLNIVEICKEINKNIFNVKKNKKENNLTSISCGTQGQLINFIDPSTPNKCCEGLKNIRIGDSISVADKCYWKGTESGSTLIICSNCGNGICEDVESVCSCPEDCIGKERSNFNTIEEFCLNGYNNYCKGLPKNFELELCNLCK